MADAPTHTDDADGRALGATVNVDTVPTCPVIARTTGRTATPMAHTDDVLAVVLGHTYTRCTCVPTGTSIHAHNPSRG
jgi:hypothetical protein